MFTYYVTIASSVHPHGLEYDVIAESSDDACISGVSYFYADHPGAEMVRVVDVEKAGAESNYSPYASRPESSPLPGLYPNSELCSDVEDSSYTPYNTFGFTAPTYDHHDTQVTGEYVPYGRSNTRGTSDAAVAGFTTSLPVAPVLETSYHKPLPNGYAPYRSFRVILPQ